MRKPDLQGPCGRAWQIKPEVEIPSKYLARWLVNRSGLSYGWWLVAVTRTTGTEYRFMIYTIDTEQCSEPQIDTQERYPVESHEITEQLQVVEVEEADRLCELGVRTILSGGLDPKKDHASYWHQLIVKNTSWKG